MRFYFIAQDNFESFIEKLIQAKKVIAPVAKKNKFVFKKLENVAELRLDYDVTILPPKKEFFPPCQPVLKFDDHSYEGCIHPEEKILFGVHFYDIKGIEITDYLFEEKNKDWNYLAHRQAATIIGSNIQNIGKRAFFSSIAKNDLIPKGHDGFITKIKAGYVYEVLTDKGKELLQYGSFIQAEETQIKEGEAVNRDILDKCPEEMKYPPSEYADKIREAFKKDEIWYEMSENCFSCGACNIVCPTCYCFDIQDLWNIDQKSGTRNRYWDACLTEDFAKISLGEGSEENFRKSRAERFRHRVMRKSVYLNEKLGRPACVGCGRCSASCTADIADPVRIIDKIMQEYKVTASKEYDKENIFLPKEAKIIKADMSTETEMLFTLKMADGSPVKFNPGEFMEVSLFGYGEIPIGYASSPTRKNSFDIVVRKVGRVSTALQGLKKGDSMYIRGPLGRGFDLNKLRDHNVLVIAGGIGLCPTRSLVQYILDRRTEFKRFTLFYGTKSPKHQIFKNDLAQMRESPDVDLFETVDQGDESWTGHVGLITTLFEKTKISSDTKVVICGPPVMFKFIIKELENIGIAHDSIFFDLERRMKCGVGKCGHCQLNDKYVCMDGPVFAFSELEDLEEALS